MFGVATRVAVLRCDSQAVQGVGVLEGAQAV